MASLWRRGVAYLTDSSALWFLGYTMGVVLSRQLMRLGAYEPLVGCFVAIAYFTWFDSKLGSGQSPGKRWMKVRVVDGEGRPILAVRALARSVVFVVPVLLWSLNLPVSRTPWPLSAAIILVVYGVGGATFSLLLFDKVRRRGLHDFATQSYVVDARSGGMVKVPTAKAMPFIVLGAWLLTVAAGGLVLDKQMESEKLYRRERIDVGLVERIEGVQRGVVRDVLLHDPHTGRADSTLDVSVVLGANATDQQAIANQAARLILQNDQTARSYDELRVRTFTGYDIGIASRWKHQEFDHSPAEWESLGSGGQPTVPTVQTHQQR